MDLGMASGFIMITRRDAHYFDEMNEPIGCNKFRLYIQLDLFSLGGTEESHGLSNIRQ